MKHGSYEVNPPFVPLPVLVGGACVSGPESGKGGTEWTVALRPEVCLTPK